MHLIRLIGSDSQIIHHPLTKTAEEPFGSRFYAQTWKFSNQQLVKRLAYQPTFSLMQTLQDTLKMAE